MWSNFLNLIPILLIAGILGVFIASIIQEENGKLREIISMISIFLIAISVLSSTVIELMNIFFHQNPENKRTSCHLIILTLVLLGLFGFIISTIFNYISNVKDKITSKNLTGNQVIYRSNFFGHSMFLSLILMTSFIFLNGIIKLISTPISIKEPYSSKGILLFIFMFGFPIVYLIYSLRESLFTKVYITEGILILKGLFREKRFVIKSIKYIEYKERRYILKILFKIPTIDIQYTNSKIETIYLFGFKPSRVQTIVTDIKN